jgi:membrane-associated phospholipid phosphatase
VGVRGAIDSTVIDGSVAEVGSNRDDQSAVETVVGSILVVVVALAGLHFAHQARAGVIDRWMQDLIPSGKGAWLLWVTWLRYPPMIVAGSVIAAAVVFRRDRPRAVACLIGPSVALVACELLVKPATGRTLGGVYSYPSGSTVGAAALATAAVLAASPQWRTLVAAVGAVLSVWMSISVVALRWHYPSDALAGLAFGIGVVLLADGLTWKLAARFKLKGRVARKVPHRQVDG